MMAGDEDIAAAYRLLSRGEHQKARALAERRLDREPHLEAGWVLLADSLMRQGDLEQASGSVERGLRFVPGSDGLLVRLALCRLHQGAFAQAQELAERLSSRQPSDPETLTSLGRVFAALDLHEQARSAFERALSVRPADPGLMFNLATSLRNFGELDAAEALYDAVLLQRGNDWEAYKNRSELRRQTQDANHVEDLKAAVRRAGQDWRGAVMLLYALGKELEDLADYEEAFESYAAGARLRRKHMTYDVVRDVERLDAIRRTFSAEWMQSRPEGYRSKEPIFIFGLPRSGSTLLERMLGAHSAVHAAGELQNFGVCTLRLAGALPDASGDVIARSAALDPRRLGEAYIESTRPRTGRSAHFIDKLPGNSLYAGLIAAALPDAVLVHIHRDPRDVGLGMFKTLFKQAYPFSYDLDELGRYIAAHEALMAHWREAMAGRIVDVAYEDLVKDPERVLSEVLSRCGLSLEPACMSFHASAKATSTASAVQVRQPVYRSAVQAWRRYERQLKPLIDRLENPNAQ